MINQFGPFGAKRRGLNEEFFLRIILLTFTKTNQVKIA